MISNSVKKGPVKIAKETASSWSSENQYHVNNVNVAMGPKTGNNGTPSKRSDFVRAKEAREPIATVIQAAYAARDQRDSIDTKLEGIRPNVKPQKFRR
jgi:hypothetical protein